MNATPVSIFSSIFALALFTSASAVRAADQLVTDFGDNGGPNQLRTKLAALQSTGGGTLTFSGPEGSTIALTGEPLPAITANSTVDGANAVTLRGGVRFFTVNAGVVLKVRNIILQQGYFNGEGGAILNNGTLNLQHTTIRNSYAPNGGGALSTTGPADIADCTFAGNISGAGAAIYAHTPMAVMTIQRSTFSGNQVNGNQDTQGLGGAIYLTDGAAATLRDSDFFNNTATKKGGAIYVDQNSALSLRSSKIRKNSADPGSNLSEGGGIFNYAGSVDLTDSTISANSATTGGGINTFGGSLTFDKATIAGNTALYGAGIYAFLGTHSFTNVTVSGNKATSSGGGIYNSRSDMTLLNVTLAANTGGNGLTGGIVNVGGGPSPHLKLTNVLIAAGPSGDNCFFETAPDLDDSNISSDNTCPFGPGRQNVQVKLGPLSNNGGATRTHALLAGSAGIDDGQETGAPARDQREYARVGTPDVGAYEFAATIPVTLANISTRLRVETGDNALIGGFILSGTHPKKVLLRAIGPSTNLAGALANPTLDLHDSSGQPVATNDDWGAAPNHAAIAATGAAPQDARESAILKTLNPGAYTAILRGANDSTGLALVEAYDLDRTTDSVLANISTRGLVQTGDNALIGGFIVVGIVPQKLIIRGIGPSLALAGKLADPLVEVHDSNGFVIDSNDNWRSTQEAEIIATGIPPANNAESALIETLNPGGYTAILSGVNGGTGLGVIEVYQLR